MKTSLKRIFSLLLALTMLLSMVPSAAFAAETEETEPIFVEESAETTAPPETTEVPTVPEETEAPETEPAETDAAPAVEKIGAPTIPEEISDRDLITVYTVTEPIERDVRVPRIGWEVDQVPEDDAYFIEVEDELFQDGIVCVRNSIYRSNEEGELLEALSGDYKSREFDCLALVLEFEGVAQNGVLAMFDEQTQVIINGKTCVTELLDEGSRIRATYCYMPQTVFVYNMSLTIPAPVAGEEAVFEAKYASPTDDRYMLGAAEGQKQTNNVRWIDRNNNTDLKPGDKFKTGHWYEALIYVKAGTGCKFCGDTTARVNGIDGVYVAAYYNTQTYERYDDEQYRVVVMEFMLEGEYDLVAEHGFVYSAEGDLITSAKSGDLVTIEAGPAPQTDVEGSENWSFSYWTIHYPTDIAFMSDEDLWKSPVTFVMPESNVYVAANYGITQMKGVNFTLGGYYSGTPASALTVFEDAPGVELGILDYGKTHVLYSDKEGLPGDLVFESDTISSGAVYWLGVRMDCLPGYAMDRVLEDELVYLEGATDKMVALNDDLSITVFFKLPTAGRAIARNIAVTNGYACVYGTNEPATVAAEGVQMELYGVVPDELAETHQFSHWEILSGDLTFETKHEMTSFVMPAGDVAVKAVYLPQISDVEVTMDLPEAGELPAYVAESLTEGVSIGEISWFKAMDTHEEPLAEGEVLDYEQRYRVRIELHIDNEHVFTENVYGFFNGEDAVMYIDEDGNWFLEYYYETDLRKYSITVEGGEATDMEGNVINQAVTKEQFRITAEVPEGYVFDHWEVPRGRVIVSWPEVWATSPELECYMLEEDVVFKAVFTALKDVPIMIVDGNGGDLNESYDIKRNNCVDMLVRKGMSSYYDQEGDVTWTTSSAAIATVERADKNYWELVFHKPGTVTVTAKDAYGCKDSIKITGFYLDGSKKLTVSSDTPSIGLQVGHRARMKIFGTDKENELSPMEFDYTVSEAGILEVHEGWLSGIKPGTVTVTAKLRDDPSGRKVTLKVTVIAAQIREVDLEYTCVNITSGTDADIVQEENGTTYKVLYIDAKDVTDSNGTIKLKPLVKNSLGEEVPLKKSLFKWASSNTKVAKVTANADGTATVTIPKKVSGMARLTLTANDKAKHQQIFIIHVRDYTPKLAKTKFTLDWWKQPENSYVPLNLAESYGNTITGVTVTEYNRVTKLYDVTSPNFEIRQEEDSSFSIGLLMNPAQSKGTVKASLNVTCADGKTYKYLISITVQNKQPKFTLVQFNPLNIFYNDCSAQLGSTFTLDGDAPLLEKLELSENNQNKDLTLVNGNTLVLTKECINRRDYNIDLNIVLKVKLFGYKPFDMNFKVKKERKYPFLVTDPGVLLITQANKNGTLKFKILDRDTGENYSSYFGREEGSSCVNNGTYLTVWKYDNGTPSDRSDDYLTVKLTEDYFSFDEYRADIRAYKDNWMLGFMPFEVTVNYVKELPKVKLSEKTLNLNSTFTQRTSVAQVSISDYTLNLSDLKLNFACTDKGGGAAFEQAQKISLTYQPGYGVVAAFKDQNDLPTAGSYTFAAIPEVNGVTLPKITVTVNVQADNSKVTITGGTAKLNKYLAGREIASVGCIVSNDLQLLGFKENGNEFVDISYSNGQIHAKLKRSDAAAKYTFELTPKVKDPASGQIVYLAKKVKLSVQTHTSDKIGIQMSYTGKLNTLNPEKVVTAFVSKVSNAAAGHQILKSMTGADADLFTYSEDAQGQITLRLKQGYTYATKKSYEVKFVYDVFGEIVTSNPVKIKITQDTYKPAITPASALYSLSYRGSTAKVLTFKISLLGAGHAKLDANSIQVNTATPLALRRAMGAAPVVKVSEDGRSALVQVSFKHSSYLDSGKSYKLILNVTPVGNASDVKAKTVTATVLAK